MCALVCQKLLSRAAVKQIHTMSNTKIITRGDKKKLFEESECVQILDKVLQQQKVKGKLLNFKIEPDLSSIGYLGEYFHLYLNYELDNHAGVQETRLFVKSIPYQNADMSVFIEKSGMMKKEIVLYSTLLNELKSFSKNIWCAHCYLARDDLFVLQNIADLGFEALATESGYLTEAQVLPILKSLATMHASSIAYEVKHKTSIGNQLKDVLIEVTVHPSVVWYTAGLNAILAVAANHPEYQSLDMQEFIRNELPARLEKVYEMVNPSEKYRNAFCHRDIWGGNIFYHKEKPLDYGCVFVDFQLSRYSPPALDVLLTMYLNVKPNVRREIMTRCCKYYYDNFSTELSTMGFDAEKELSRTEFEESLREFELFGASYNCLAATILRVPDNFLKNLKDHHPEHFHRYTNVERTPDLLELMSKNKEFRALMYDYIQEMLEVAIK